MTPVVRKWILEPHLCSDCGGRILLCVEGNGMTPGGNQIHRCADCGKSGTSHGADAICWCGVSHKGNNTRAYRCLAFSILEQEPWLEEGFRACGCDPGRGEVGIIMVSDLTRLRENKTPKETAEAAVSRYLQPVHEALDRAQATPSTKKADLIEVLKTKLDLAAWGLSTFFKR